MISCGYNHSMAVTDDGKLYGWGLSRNDELGFAAQSGHFQAGPFPVELYISGTNYLAYQLACGAAHTAVILKEEGTEKLRLIYSPFFDMTEVMNRVKDNLIQKNMTLDNYRLKVLGGEWTMNTNQVRDFFRKYLSQEDQTHLEEITKLFMTKAKPGGLLFKEFRDQIHGMRLGEGLVATWGLDTNGRLGRKKHQDQSEDQLNRFVSMGNEVVIRKVACGDSHTLALGQGKYLCAWGGNQYGQLGNGLTVESAVPVQIRLPDNVDIIDIAAGGMHSLCATMKFMAYSWGYGEGGRLGQGDSQLELSPKLIEGLTDVIAVAAGHSQSGFICTDKVYTCGKGLFARLGHGTLNDELRPRNVEFFQGKSLIKLSLSFFNSAALTLNGEAYAWGDSKYGRCGTGISNGENILIPRRIGAGTMLAAMKITDIALGLNHGMAVTVDGSVYVWGDASDGKLGLVDHKEIEPFPKVIPGLDLRAMLDDEDKGKKRPVNSTKIVGVAANDFCTAVVTDAGEIKIWGNNTEGQLGVGDEEIEEEEDIIAEDEDETTQHRKALKDTKDLYDPTFIPFFHSSKTIKVARVAAAGNHFFVITLTGMVYGWGSNRYGQLGLDSDSQIITQPALLKSFRMMKVRRIATSPKHTAFVMDSGETFMCGNVNNGKLGLGISLLEGETKSVFIPRQLRSIVNVDRVACGSDHTFVYSMAGKLFSWGSGYLGCLGNGDSRDIYEPMVVRLESFVPPLLNAGIKDIACGDFHSLVVTTEGQIFACGLAQYAGLAEKRGSVFNFTLVTGFRQKMQRIYAGREHSLATTVSGQLYAWGKNTSNRLTGSVDNYHPEDDTCLLPSMIFVDIVATKATCGAAHTCALSKTGEVYLWGVSANGRLGLGYDPEDVRREVVTQPELNSKVQVWLNASKELESKSEKKQVVVNDNLQKLIKNEPNNCAEDELMSDGAGLISQLISILEQLNAFKQLENARIREMNSIETLIVSGLPLLPSRIPSAKFFISMPVVISRNIQLFELMVALLQHHPCYILAISRGNAQLSPSETANHISHLYGDITDNSRLMKIMMALLFTLSEDIIGNLSEEQIMNERSGSLIDGIKGIILSSQTKNTKFFKTLTQQIILIIIQLVFPASLEQIPEDFLSQYNAEEVAVLDLGQESLQAVFQERSERLMTLVEPVKDYIVAALCLSPQVRLSFKGISLTQELKFLYKELSRIISKRFSYVDEEKLKKVNRIKIFQMFIPQIVTYLKDISELELDLKDELTKALAEHNQLLRDTFELDSMVTQLTHIISLVANMLHGLADDYETHRVFLNDVYVELLRVPDFRLSDLLLRDFILHSTDSQDPILTIGTGELLLLYQLIYQNRWRLEQQFNHDDPLLQITESLGDINAMIDALQKTDVFNQKINLRIPSRWLLREQALQLCPDCTMPLTYSMLQGREMAGNVKPDSPISVPNKWRCKACGTSQEGWSGTCYACSDIREEYPKSALFKTYISLGKNPIILAFTQLLRMMPEIPDHIPLITFIEKMQSEPKSAVAAKILEIETLARRSVTVSGEGIPGLKKLMPVLSQEARIAYDHRASHRSYLDGILTLLNSVSNSLKQAQMQRNVLINSDFKRVEKAIEQGNAVKILKPAFTLSERSRAYGEFSLYRMVQDGTLKNQEIPVQQRKKTTVSFSELDDGTFEVKFLFIERANAIKLSHDDLVVQLYNFKITPERQNLMRRTMHYQATTAFEDGILVFDVGKLISLLNRLV